jgi:hypothetical protein
MQCPHTEPAGFSRKPVRPVTVKDSSATGAWYRITVSLVEVVNVALVIAAASEAVFCNDHSAF